MSWSASWKSVCRSLGISLSCNRDNRVNKTLYLSARRWQTAWHQIPRTIEQENSIHRFTVVPWGVSLEIIGGISNCDKDNNAGKKFPVDLLLGNKKKNNRLKYKSMSMCIISHQYIIKVNNYYFKVNKMQQPITRYYESGRWWEIFYICIRVFLML